jgi:uncharacterized membrane protein
MAILWLLIIGPGILLLRALFPKSADKPPDLAEKPADKPTRSAVQTLSRRYARGEISEEQLGKCAASLKVEAHTETR